MKRVLAFETSCDDTAVAIVDTSGKILSDVIYSQIEEFKAFGGVVPEMGSRAHIEQILPLTKRAFKEALLKPQDIDAVAATFAPGLIGPLLVGAQFAKGFATANGIPLLAIHHLEGHVLAGYQREGFPKDPFIALIASGGHSALYHCHENNNIKLLGQTLDDAAGEAFDKIGRSLGLGYPAGAKIDELAKSGDSERFNFTIAMEHESHFNFSFSGLKTKALSYIKESLSNQEKADLCASVQSSIVKALAKRAVRACQSLGIKDLVIGGGVAANSHLRSTLKELCQKDNINLFLPPVKHCVDNAVMIANAAIMRLKRAEFSSLDTDVYASMSIERKNELIYQFHQHKCQENKELAVNP